MKKVLFVATVDSHIELFHLPFLKMFKDKGYEVHVATESDKSIKYCDKKIKLPIKRSPFKVISNYKAIRELKKVLAEEKYELVHCHTPVGGVVARMAAKKARRNGTRVIYTAHGFHFYKGAPMHFWMMFYPIEWYLAKFTDTLITINNEDFERAKKRFAGRCFDIQYVPGIGVDAKKFKKKMSAKEKSAFKKSLGLSSEDKVLICVGRLDKNKNQGALIREMTGKIAENSNCHLLLVGPDENNGKYQKLVKKLGVEKNVHFLGFRNDVPELLQISDVLVSRSKREGLPVNLIEAKMNGAEIDASDCRGNRDVKKYDAKKFSLENVEKKMSEIYFRKKRVLHVLASNKFSGAENVACMIIRNLSDDFEMVYCSPNGPIKNKLQEMNIKYFGVDKLSRRNFNKIAKKYNPDIIHAHDYRASLVASRFGEKYKVVSHIHQDNPDARRLGFGSIVYRLISSKFSNIIWASDAALDNFYFKNVIYKKSAVFRNVVDADYIRSKAKAYEVNKCYDIIFIGRLIKVKNPIRALDVVRLVKECKSDVRMAMVGDGELREEVQTVIEKYGLKENVDLVGFKDNPYPILAHSKVLLVTSEREGTPMVILEAQALGKPVVSVKIDGFEKMIRYGENGILSNDDEVNVRCIMQILNKGDYEYFSRNTKKIFAINDRFVEYMDKMRCFYA